MTGLDFLSCMLWIIPAVVVILMGDELFPSDDTQNSKHMQK